MTIFVARRRRCAAGFINRAKVLGRSPGKYTSCCRPRLVIVVAKLRRGTSTNVSSPTNAAPVVYPRLNRASTSSPLMTTFRPASARPFVAESSTTEFGDGSFVAYILEQWRNFFLFISASFFLSICWNNNSMIFSFFGYRIINIYNISGIRDGKSILR